MLTIEFTVNILVLGIIVLLAALAGYAFGRKRVSGYREKIEELERDVLNNYAQILELEKENTSMENKLQDIKIPVIPLKLAEAPQAHRDLESRQMTGKLLLIP